MQKWFDRGVVVGAWQAGLSISEPADLLGFSHTTVHWGFTQNERKNIQ